MWYYCMCYYIYIYIYIIAKYSCRQTMKHFINLFCSAVVEIAVSLCNVALVVYL